jgi:predicted dehydrogenase
MYTMAFAGFRHSHINALYRLAEANKDIRIAGAFEQDDAARAAAAKDPGADFRYGSYEELLSDAGVDIVAIGDYYSMRGPRAIAALKAGKNVFADKPLCTSLAELAEIEELSKKSKLKVGCMLDQRYSAFIPYVRDLIQKGGLGRVQTVYFGGQHPLMYGARPSWYFEEGKHLGTINDIAIHGIDTVYHLTGLEPVRVIGAREWNGFAAKEPQFKDCAQFVVELSNGAGLMGDVSYASPDALKYNSPFYWRYTIFGTEGVVEFGTNLNEVRVSVGGRPGVEYIIPPAVDSGNCLSTFINELAGAEIPGGSNTAVVIRSSRNTLKIQEAANA